VKHGDTLAITIAQLPIVFPQILVEPETDQYCHKVFTARRYAKRGNHLRQPFITCKLKYDYQHDVCDEGAIRYVIFLVCLKAERVSLIYRTVP